MSGTTSRKRRGDDPSRPKAEHLGRKRRKQLNAYHSDSDSVDDDNGSDNDSGSEQGFQAVDLLDSDNDALDDDVLVDDGVSSSDGDASDSDSNDALDSLNEDGTAKRKLAMAKTLKVAKITNLKRLHVSDAPGGDNGSSESDGSHDEHESGNENDAGSTGTKSKRNDPGTFAMSMKKILGTKLSTTRRADPVLARSAEAREASRQGVDAALEDKARRQMRLEKRAAMDKGRVKDVLIATNRPSVDGNGDDKEAETTATIRATEKRLRKVAQRGVVQLFNAVRAAQVKAAQAKRLNRAEGVLGMDKREAKVAEMSRKGFLDLIASGGGGLKRDGLEEA